MKYFSVFFTFLAALFLYAAEPVVKIPRITAEKAAELAAADSFWAPDWEGAAVIRTFTNHQGFGSIPLATSFYLFHDGENLWAAAHCAENDFSTARAFERDSMDDLTLDEAVQVVIGFDGKVTTNMTMGVYEGAYGTLGNCAHLYEMTVNMANSASRSFDETLLRDVKFDHATVEAEGGWAALLRIPFASVGYNWQDNPMVHFNLFRFSRDVRYGWYLPSFGGYNKLPVGKAELLDFDRNGEATVEPVRAIAPTVSASENSIPVRGRLDIEYYAAAGEVAAEVPSGRKGSEITLTVNGESISATGSSHWATRLELPAKFEAGTKITAVLSCDGKELLREEFTALEPPAWRFGVAMEYLEERVPHPWATPEFSDGTLTLTHGTVEFGDGMFPVSIFNSRNQEILAGPITLEAEVDGVLLPVNARASYSQTATAVEMVSEALPGLEIKTRTEYDGFMTVRARLTGLETTIPDTLRLRIPLTEGLAEYVSKGSTQQLIRTGGHGYCGNNSWELWVGNRQGGMIFTYGHQVFYSDKDGRQIVVDGDEILLTFVSEDGLTPPEDNVFEFHLQFTPFRSDFIPLLDSIYWFEEWSEWQSYPDMRKLPEIAQRVQDSAAKGRQQFIYFGHTVAENAPESVKYPTDFISYPRRPDYTRAYGISKGIPCSITCFRGEIGEFMLDNIETIVEETGLPGIYLDGPTVPFTCENLNHNCSPNLPALWDGSWHDGNVAGQRSYIKRLRGIFDSRGHKNPIWHHTGGYFGLVHFSHCDFYWDGEQLSRYRKGYLLPPEIFSVIYSGYPFGYQGVFFPFFYIDSTLRSSKGRAWVAPHHVISAAGTSTSYESYLRINKRHPDTEFYPYTAEQPHIQILNENTLCTSYYLAENEAVLMSSNIVYEGTQENIIDISGLFPGEELQVRCLNREETPDFENGILKFSVAVRGLNIYHIAPASVDVSAFDLPDPTRPVADVPPAVPLMEQYEIDPAKWTFKAEEFVPVAESGLEYGLRANGSPARMIYNESLPDNFNFKLKFRHSGKFKFVVDGLEITFDYHQAGKGWFIDKIDPNDCLEVSDVTVAAHGRSYSVLDRPVEVDVYLIDGRVTLYYDGVRILQYGLPAVNHENGHTLMLETADNYWVAFDVEYFGPAEEADMPRLIHPIL